MVLIGYIGDLLGEVMDCRVGEGRAIGFLFLGTHETLEDLFAPTEYDFDVVKIAVGLIRLTVGLTRQGNYWICVPCISVLVKYIFVHESETLIVW
jgi:hypothetical protein